MSKFTKRLSKLTKNSPQNALVIGEGFGFIEDIISIFQTVFVIDRNRPKIKSKNLVYRQNFDDLQTLVDITHVFFDLKNITDITYASPVFTRWKPFVIIEGNVIPSAEFTRPLINQGYKCYRLDGFFHPWELK